MGNPYTSVTVTNYNPNPPPDDGSLVAGNLISWANEKQKLTDPLKDAIEDIDANVTAGFGKVIGGAGITSTAISYTILAADQGKLIKGTAAGITITTPDATSVTSPFVCAVLNNSSGSQTLDGNGAQTIDGAASITLGAGQGCFLFTDGTNWNTAGLGAVLSGNQIGYGAIINGYIAESNASNAVTFAVKTLAGNDPSATDPVILAFRSPTLTSGVYVYRSIAAALSLVIPSTATMGASNGIAFRLWLTLFDDGGTIRLGAINCVSGTSIYPLGQIPRVTSTLVSTSADVAQTFYTNGAGVTSKSYLLAAYANYESGLATAGTWNVSPTSIQPFGPGVPLPGQLVQPVQTLTTATTSGSTALPFDDTIPQITEGDQYLSQAITPTSAANLLQADWVLHFGAASAVAVTTALFQDATAAALTAGGTYLAANPLRSPMTHTMLAGTTSSTTLKVRAGTAGGATLKMNAQDNATRVYGGVCTSSIAIREIMG
jgi:hypothetical protein